MRVNGLEFQTAPGNSEMTDMVSSPHFIKTLINGAETPLGLDLGL